MISIPMDILEQYPVRKSKKQKKAFREAVQAYTAELGYEYHEEPGSFGSRNVVIGNPDRAKYLVTAHYDTCAHLPFPNFITPCNFLMYLLYQIMILVLFFGVLGILYVALEFVLQDSYPAYLITYAMLWVMLLSMYIGPANQHNANDNTSGVVTVLEIARTLPENQRDNVCFVLFDLEEAGLVGSASYRNTHKAATKNQIILNLDCIGDGNEIVMFPSKKLKKDKQAMEELSKVQCNCGEKSLRLHQKGFSFYPSDQSNFPLGVGIAAFRRKKIIGLYCSRIHTNRDTILEQTNVNILRAAITTLICQ